MMNFHALIHKEKDEELYSAICLELNISVDGATAESAFKRLREAVDHYVSCVLKDKDYQALSRPAPAEYWDEFFKSKASRKIELEKVIA